MLHCCSFGGYISSVSSMEEIKNKEVAEGFTISGALAYLVQFVVPSVTDILLQSLDDIEDCMSFEESDFKAIYCNPIDSTKTPLGSVQCW
jgi:hypothetical protein